MPLVLESGKGRGKAACLHVGSLFSFTFRLGKPGRGVASERENEERGRGKKGERGGGGEYWSRVRTPSLLVSFPTSRGIGPSARPERKGGGKRKGEGKTSFSSLLFSLVRLAGKRGRERVRAR